MTTDQLVAAGLPLTDRLVRRYLARRPAHIDRDAIRGAANEALVQAAHSYDQTRGVPFDAWAHRRITGAMHDETRRTSPGTRGKPALQHTLLEGDAVDTTSTDRTIARLDLRQALDTLPTPQRTIVVAVAAGYALRELSALHTVTESAIWQRKQQAHAALRTRLAA